LTAEDVGTGLVNFLAVSEVSLEIHLLPGSRHPGPLIPLRFCSLHHLSCLCTHLKDGLQIIVMSQYILFSRWSENDALGTPATNWPVVPAPDDR
jgi:hypothetical protein